MMDAIRRATELGVTDDLPLDRAIPVRATNSITLILMVVAIAGGLGSYFDLGDSQLAIFNLIFFLLYAIAMLLNGSRLYDAARFSVIGVGALHYFTANISVGSGSGMEFYVAPLASMPLLMFSKAEGRKLLAAYLLIASALLAMVLVLVRSEAGHPIADPAMQRLFYASTALVTLTTLCAVAYYNYSSIAARLGLEREQQRVEQLLSHILPDLIAKRLRQGDTMIADSHGEATVLFADLAGFTNLARKLAPNHVVEILNDLFSRLDDLAAQYGVEKIKTIGDCYMAATGVLGLDEGQVEAMADFALAVPMAVRDVSEKYNYPLGVRVGIGTGPAISGVIGTEKYTFDLWGDTVNLASQMEVSGVEGRIQVTEATYWRLQGTFDLKKRGEIAVKGETSVPSYFLIGRKTGRKTGQSVKSEEDPVVRLVK